MNPAHCLGNMLSWTKRDISHWVLIMVSLGRLQGDNISKDQIEVMGLSKGWVQICQDILDQMKKLSEKKDKDRLDLVQSMRFSLYALHRSILGWLNWVSNPDIMSSFKQEELDEMNERLAKYVQEFIEYDVEITEKGADKNLAAQKARREIEERARRGPEDIFYI